MFTMSVYNVQLRNIGRAKCIGLVCPTNHIVGRATAIPANYVPAPMAASTTGDRCRLPTRSTVWKQNLSRILFDRYFHGKWSNYSQRLSNTRTRM